MSDFRVLLGIIFAFIVGFFVFVAKIQFVQKILAANVDVNTFNLSLALCFVASGENVSLFYGWLSFEIFRCWDDDIPSVHSLAYWDSLQICE